MPEKMCYTDFIRQREVFCMWQELFPHMCIHLFFFIGVVYLVGFLISLINRAFYRLLGGGRFVCFVTGLIGTPIHELSHALMCLLFGHRIREMRLFCLDRRSGVLGYVNHSYNRRNPYHVMGNYFIGIAPIVCGTLILFLTMRWMLPSAFAVCQDYLSDFVDWQGQGEVLRQVEGIGALFVSFLSILYVEICAGGWQIWVFLLLILAVSIHMNLSGADMKGSLGALPILVLLLLIGHVIAYLLPGGAYVSFVRALDLAGNYLAGMLMLSLLFSVLSLIPALLIWLIRRPFAK